MQYLPSQNSVLCLLFLSSLSYSSIRFNSFNGADTIPDILNFQQNHVHQIKLLNNGDVITFNTELSQKEMASKLRQTNDNEKLWWRNYIYITKTGVPVYKPSTAGDSIQRRQQTPISKSCCTSVPSPSCNTQHLKSFSKLWYPSQPDPLKRPAKSEKVDQRKEGHSGRSVGCNVVALSKLLKVKSLARILDENR